MLRIWYYQRMADEPTKPLRAAPTPIRFQPRTVKRLDEEADRRGISRNRLVELAVQRFLDGRDD